MTTSTLMGVFCVVVALGLIVWVFYPKGNSLVTNIQKIRNDVSGPLKYVSIPSGEIGETLETMPVGGTIQLNGESGVLVDHVNFQPMAQENGRGLWQVSGFSALKALVLRDGSLIMQIPLSDGGSGEWVFVKPVKVSRNFQKFFTGDKENPGPARKFKDGKQKSPVSFDISKLVYLEGDPQMQVVDIGAISAQRCYGDQTFIHQGDMYFTVVCRAGQTTRVMVVLDSRVGSATGKGGLFDGHIVDMTQATLSVLK